MRSPRRSAPRSAPVDDADIREIAILFRVVETVADHKSIFDLEADVLDFDIDLTPGRLAEQTRRAQRLRPAGAEDLLQVGEGQARVDDVFDNNDVPAVQGGVEIFQQPDLSRRRRALGVARNRHEIERDLSIHPAYQVREEDEGALEHGDEMQAIREVAPDLRRQLADPRLNLSFAQQHVDWHGTR